MDLKPLRCCENSPIFLIHYVIGSNFYVCASCIELDFWARDIQEKEPISKKTEKLSLHKKELSKINVPVQQPRSITGTIMKTTLKSKQEGGLF